MVRLRNAYANLNDTITLFSIQMQMSMHLVIVTAIVNMADFIIIYHNNNNTISQPHHCYSMNCDP